MNTIKLVDDQVGLISAEVNEYGLLNFKRTFKTPADKKGTQEFQKIIFYKLNPDGSYENGTTLEEVLGASLARLNDLNKRFSCRENSLAITKIEEALMWLNKRTENRKKEARKLLKK